MIEKAVLIDDQPIAASLFGEDRWLTDWVTPDSLEIQSQYEKLTEGLTSAWDKALACFNRVLDIPYTEAVRVRVSVDGKTFTQNDVWLEPGQALKADTHLNCANRAFLLASLLRRDYPANKVWTVFGNLRVNGLGGHAWVLLREQQDYILETTSPRIRTPITNSDAHEGVIYFNDQEVRAVPGLELKQPFSKCWCHPFLEDYLDAKQCYNLSFA